MNTTTRQASKHSLKEVVTITNKLGLHARAAAVFVQVASKFSANIHLKKTKNATTRQASEQDISEQDALNSDWINGKSILNVMTLDAGIGSQIIIKVEGHDAMEALNRLVKLINDKFGEKE